MTMYAVAEATEGLLLTAWRHNPAHPSQLVHAVEPRGHIAECGVEVTVFGRPWPDPGTGTMQLRCSICAHSVDSARVHARPVSLIH